jgi:hypothetical protein
MEQPKKEKYKNKSELKQHKDIDWIEKAMGVATHPLTAFGYAARNEDLPDNFEKANNTNPLDDVIGMVNPARRFKSGVNAMESVGKGDFQKATLDAIGAINPWTKSLEPIRGTGRLARNRRVVQAVEYAASKVPLADTFVEGVSGMDFASLLEEDRKVQKKNKLKK